MLVTATKRHLGSMRRVGKACKTLRPINRRTIIKVYMQWATEYVRYEGTGLVMSDILKDPHYESSEIVTG